MTMSDNQQIMRQLENGTIIKTRFDSHAVLHDGLVYVLDKTVCKEPSRQEIVSLGTHMTQDSFREFYLTYGKSFYPYFNTSITITPECARRAKDMLTLTGKELYGKYGWKHDETITQTVVFDDSYEMDIKCVMPISENETGWSEAVLFKDGRECCCTDPADEFLGKWTLEDDGIHFCVTLTKQTKG